MHFEFQNTLFSINGLLYITESRAYKNLSKVIWQLKLSSFLSPMITFHPLGSIL